MAKNRCITVLPILCEPIGRDHYIAYMKFAHENGCLNETVHRAHGGNAISSGMASGSLDVSGDADCSDSPGADSSPAASSGDDDGDDADPEPARRRPKNPSQAPAPLPSGIARNIASTTDAKKTPPQDSDIALWRLPTVLATVPVSRSGWWAGVKSGRYPQPVRLSARCVAWRAADIRQLVESL